MGERASQEHKRKLEKIEQQRAKDEAEAKKNMDKLQQEAAKELQAAERDKVKMKSELDKQLNKGKLDREKHDILMEELEKQMTNYKIEFDMAKTAMEAAIREGRTCTMNQNPPYIKGDQVVQGHVTWRLK